MKYIADLHIHSKYSRATAKNLDFENLYIATQLKGITVVGTGDFTHPAWFAEIQEKLIPAEPGLFRLKDDIAKKCDLHVPESCRGEVRFILQCEISNIYKKNGKTRKNHHILFAPDIETVSRFNAKLDNIGNIKSDGKPILGLDAKLLLKILLDTSFDSFLIPAHIWTPWFSVLGSKSGFDSLEECFEELTSEIFAAETGLSSDPPMNWRVSGLDKVTLVSNSDAHSPMNLGRNANLFDTELSYFAVKSALKNANPKEALGTLDMYPEEGKYHLDGHRKCQCCLHPAESMKKKGICPVCGKPLTIGVLYRVEELADRAEGIKPERGLPFYHIIPLAEILSEILNVGTKSKKVDGQYQAALESLGSELNILLNLSKDEIDHAGIPLLSEAVRRMREGNVHISPGYDGEYGKITLFTPDEREKLMGQHSLFFMPGSEEKKIIKKRVKREDIADNIKVISEKKPVYKKTDSPLNLNDEQYKAVEHEGSPLLIIAGPGAGKTLTLTHRIAYMIQKRNISPENILALTFTNKAAQEMKERLKILLGNIESFPSVGTFHAISFQMLKSLGYSDYSIIDEDEQKAFFSEAIRQVKEKGIQIHVKPNRLADMIMKAKQQILTPGDNLEAIAEKSDTSLLTAVYQAYQQLLAQEHCYDYEDLILNVVKILETDNDIRLSYQNQWKYIFVDEYQDLNHGEYRFIRALAPVNTELCVIGDPDQAIYGFRGSDIRYFQAFVNDYPDSRVIRLTKNYRSTETILTASHQVIKDHSIDRSSVTRVYSNIQGIKTLTILELVTEKSEAVAVGKAIENMIGGIGFHSIDFGKTDEKTDRTFSDFAVLYRTNAQSQIISEVFDQAGIPYQIVSKENLYKRKGIAELLSFLKITEDRRTFNDFKKVEKYTDKLSEIRNNIREKSVEDKLIFIAENTDISDIINENPKTAEAFQALIHTAKSCGNNISDFFEIIALQTHDTDIYDLHAEKVALMTMHAAKGLEFPVVFIAGCEQDYIPFRHPGNDDVDIDEERRLFYVGMTRAKEQLFLTHVKKRIIYGKTIEREISPFVAVIEKQLITLEKYQAKKGKKESLHQFGLFG